MPQDNQQAVWDETYQYRKKKYTRIVTEGDSWFCYPMWRSMMDFISESNQFALCRRGESGRTLRQIVDDEKYLKAVKSEKPAALLLSGGGNDFVNHDFVTGAKDGKPLFDRYESGMTADDVINDDKWDAKLNELGDCFEDIVANVGTLPVFAHGYDYIIPSGVPAAYDGLHVAGPWIRPSLIDQLVPESLHRPIVRLMIDSVNTLMASVASATATFTHIDLRQTAPDSDWANEIHPYESGFTRFADKYLHTVNHVLAHPVLIVAAGGNP